MSTLNNFRYLCYFFLSLIIIIFSDRYLDVGRDIITSLQYGTHCPCGYCHIADVETHVKDDHMESFFLSETVS